MKKWLKSLSKEQIQRYVFVGLLVLVFAAFFISLSIASNNEKNEQNNPPIENPDDNQNNNNDNNNQTPEGDNNAPNAQTPKVEKMNMPLSGEFVVVRKYYDKDSSSEEQELAVIQFGKRYYTSNGISVSTSKKHDFNVLAALSGEVVTVDESPIYGIVVTIKHNDDLFTEYGSLSKANVVAGDKVNQGDIIGVSGVCEYDSTLDSHVYFKVLSSQKTYNPELVIGKTIQEIVN